MTVHAFIEILEKSFSKNKVRLGPSQRSVYEEKLRRFSDEQLDSIFEKVLEMTRTFPKIKDLFDAARELNFLQTAHDEFRPHRWNSTNCGLCRGEGRIAIMWRCFREEGREIQELVQVFPYALSFDYAMKPNEYRSVFRCRCLAGDATSLPRTWPKWSNSSAVRRERAL